MKLVAAMSDINLHAGCQTVSDILVLQESQTYWFYVIQPITDHSVSVHGHTNITIIIQQ